MSEPTVLVTGTTGRIGEDLIEVLATEDVHVQTMTRRPDRVPESLEQRTELVKLLSVRTIVKARARRFIPGKEAHRAPLSPQRTEDSP